MNAQNNPSDPIEVEEVVFGGPQRFDPGVPRDDVFIPKEELDARQEALGETRKYAGPFYEGSDEPIQPPSVYPTVPPTDCEEPSTTNGT